MVVDAVQALRVLNHYIRRRQAAGATAELELLEDVQDFLRGQVVLDRRVALRHESRLTARA